MDIKEDGHYDTEVFRKETKLPIHWSSETPKRYKRNSIKGGLQPRKLQQIFKEKLHQCLRTFPKETIAGNLETA